MRKPVDSSNIVGSVIADASPSSPRPQTKDRDAEFVSRKLAASRPETETYVDSVAAKSLYQRWKNTKDPELKRLFTEFKHMAKESNRDDRGLEEFLMSLLEKGEAKVMRASEKFGTVICKLNDNKEKLMKSEESDPVETIPMHPLKGVDNSFADPENLSRVLNSDDDSDSDADVQINRVRHENSAVSEASPKLLTRTLPTEEAKVLQRIRSGMASSASSHAQPEYVLCRLLQLLGSDLPEHTVEAELVLTLGCTDSVASLLELREDCRRLVQGLFYDPGKALDAKQIWGLLDKLQDKEQDRTISEFKSMRQTQAANVFAEMGRKVAPAVASTSRITLKSRYRITRATTDKWVDQSFYEPKTESVPLPGELRAILQRLGLRQTLSMDRARVEAYQRAYSDPDNLLLVTTSISDKEAVTILALFNLFQASNYDATAIRALYLTTSRQTAEFLRNSLGNALPSVKVLNLVDPQTEFRKSDWPSSQLILVSPEKLDFILRADGNPGTLLSTQLLVADELQALGENHGAVYEFILMKLFIGRSRTSSRRLIGFSTPLSNISAVAKFLHAEPCVMSGEGLYRFIGCKEGQDWDVEIVCELVQERLLVLFLPSTDEATQFAEKYADFSHRRAPRKRTHRTELYNKLTKDCTDPALKRLYSNGVGLIHPLMEQNHQDMFRSLFSHGEIEVLVMAAESWDRIEPDPGERNHLTFIKGVTRTDPVTGQVVPLSVLEVQNMLRMSSKPRVILPYKGMQREVNRIMGFAPLESRLLEDLCDLLNAEIGVTVNNVDEAKEWLDCSFFRISLETSPGTYNYPGTSHEIMKETLERLVQEGLIEEIPAEGSLVRTKLGKRAAELCISHRTVGTLYRKLGKERDLLRLVACSKEFEDFNRAAEMLHAPPFVLALRKVFPASPGEPWVLSLLRYHVQDKTELRIPPEFATLYENLLNTAARVMKGLFFIALHRRLADCPQEALRCSIRLKRRMRENSSFARQFGRPSSVPWKSRKESEEEYLSEDVLKLMEAHPENFLIRDVLLENDQALLLKSFGSIGYVLSLCNFLKHFPIVKTEVSASWDKSGEIKADIHIRPQRQFVWSRRWNKECETYWLIVDDRHEVLKSRQFVLHEKELGTDPFELRVRKQPTTEVLRFSLISDSWLDVESESELVIANIQTNIKDVVQRIIGYSVSDERGFS